MRKVCIVLVMLCLSMMIAGKAMALSLSLEPHMQDIQRGEYATVDLNISGLGNGVPDSLGAFSLDIVFDNDPYDVNSPVIFTTANWPPVFGSSLGNPDMGEALTFVDAPVPGVLYLDEVSLLFDWELDLLQGDSFTLATFTLWGADLGTTVMSVENVSLSDAWGSMILADETGGVYATASINVVPEPSTFLLLGISLAGLAGADVRRRRKKKAIANS